MTLLHIHNPYSTKSAKQAITALASLSLYCLPTWLISIVAIVPVTVMNPTARQVSTDVPYHPTYNGVVFFRNTFDGKLPATDYPKVNVSRKRIPLS